MGRSSTYTEAAAEEICNRIANGETLRAICRDERMPSWRTVYDWLNEHPDFAAHIARARELGFDAIAEQTIEIAEDGRNDFMQRETEKGVIEVFNAEHVQRSKLRIETRLKLLAKWSPKKYGEATKVELTGPNGGPVQISEPERAERVASLLAAAKERLDNDINSLV